MKLHLGCGEIYLKGYINVDFPSSEHSVQQECVADVCTDILRLRYTAESIQEIRLHHVFEHLSQPIALALLVSWRSWLITGGILRIEVPDFDKTASRVLSPFTTDKQKYVALRHIFGSQEASWAHHCEGWSEKRLKRTLILFGFRPTKTTKNKWKGTYNIDITAFKTDEQISRGDFRNKAKNLLSSYLLDNSTSEERLLKIWTKIYSKQIRKTWAK